VLIATQGCHCNHAKLPAASGLARPSKRGGMTVHHGSNISVCILGMHRSGTSCLAGSLEERGLFLGEVINYAKFNIKGNKENHERMKINNDVLAMNGGTWDAPPQALVWDDALRHARDVHIARYSDRKIWGLKDPRMLYTLPFWQEADLDIRFVGTFRHPTAVEKSLMRRGEGLQPKTPAIELWKRYNLKLLDYLSQRTFPLVCFDWVPSKYIRTVDLISCELGLQVPPGAPPGFFEDDLRSSNQGGTLPDCADTEAMHIYDRLAAHC
jgi:hypothetical protein